MLFTITFCSLGDNEEPNNIEIQYNSTETLEIVLNKENSNLEPSVVENTSIHIDRDTSNTGIKYKYNYYI